ncbi:TPA: tyrosine-type recombinase/integrase [Clostridium perfringens]|uniref:tyrosine-type recombinase/integrase n=1 Tax=Clostridium perfringens TaxID=1502 RepID=UPI001A2B06CA|nr:tyrosine-type recombinase/integrase [Clostridium perfringens]MDC4243917.1 tyrosine-type recombinase/integrase [Clostridium perfringens]HAT4245820.1 tyrosine-type recombinase/integrase [Clostridium perfringens]
MNRYIVRERNIEVVEFGEKETKRIAVILEEIKSDDGEIIELPSALNAVIYQKYKNKSITNAKNIAITVCEFLNFVKDMCESEDDSKFIALKEEGLYGLDFYHLASFLNFCVTKKKNIYYTIKQKENRLFEFYDYLIKANLLKSNVKFKYKLIKDAKNKRNRVQISPFNELEYIVSYPHKNAKKKTKRKNLEEHLFELLIELSQKYTPSITLGIVIQSMGGLRKGELVNLRVQDLELDNRKHRMDAIVEQRHHELFMDRSVDLEGCGVKKPRKQVIFNMDGSLYKHFEKHMNYRTSVFNKKGTFSSALMIDSKGQAMTGYTYEQQFQKLKKIFLETVKNTSYSTYSSLKRDKWSTHICRGIFTNACISKGYAKNIRDLANLRGDFSEKSSKVYWDAAKLAVGVSDTLNKLNTFEGKDEYDEVC